MKFEKSTVGREGLSIESTTTFMREKTIKHSSLASFLFYFVHFSILVPFSLL